MKIKKIKKVSCDDALKKKIKELNLLQKKVEKFNALKKKINKLKEKAQTTNAYKKLVLTAAKSEYKPEDVVAGLKFAAKLIAKKDWRMVEKISGISGDLMVRGVCSKCDINLVGKEPKPRDFTLPCLIKGCIYNKEEMKGIQ